ncbi:hypothetical protein ACJX0J_025959, partial [Zea mays]
NNIIIDLLKVDKNFICYVVHRSVTIWVFHHHLQLSQLVVYHYRFMLVNHMFHFCNGQELTAQPFH